MSRPAQPGPGEADPRPAAAALRRHPLLPPGGRGAAVREGAAQHALVPGGAARPAAHPPGGRHAAEVAHRGEEEYAGGGEMKIGGFMLEPEPMRDFRDLDDSDIRE